MTQSAPWRMTPREKKSSISLAGIFALRMLGLFVILPVFAIYARELPGGVHGRPYARHLRARSGHSADPLRCRIRPLWKKARHYCRPPDLCFRELHRRLLGLHLGHLFRPGPSGRRRHLRRSHSLYFRLRA